MDKFVSLGVDEDLDDYNPEDFDLDPYLYNEDDDDFDLDDDDTEDSDEDEFADVEDDPIA